MKFRSSIAIDATNIKSGGGINHLLKLINKFNNEKKVYFEEIHIWGEKDTLSLIKKRDWIKLHYYNSSKKPFIYRSIFQFFILPFLVKRENCQLLFALGGLGNPFFIPLVSMCQNLIPFSKKEIIKYWPTPQFFKHIILFIIQSITFRFSKSVIFTSNYSYIKIKKIIRKVNNPHIIYHGIDEDFINPRINELKKISNNENLNYVRLVYISSLEFYKNHKELIYMFRKYFTSTNKNCSLEFYGPSNISSNKRILPLINQSKLENIPINFHGEANHNEVKTILSNTDIFIWASTCEAFGMGLLEAMAMGIPILAAEYPTNREILGEGGLYFNIKEYNSFIYQINKINNSKDLRIDLTNKARNKAKLFNWEKTSLDTFKALHIHLNKK